MCKKHPEIKTTVCGAFVCGLCYAEALETTRERGFRATPETAFAFGPSVSISGGLTHLNDKVKRVRTVA